MKFLHLTAVAATALAVVAGTAGCGGNNETDHSAHAISTALQAPSAAVNPTSASATSPGLATSPAIATAPAAAVEDVSCGPVIDAGGGTRTVIAIGTPAGRVGCTEAINVATKYATTVSNTDAQTIDGWQCNAQPDPATPSKCTRDGLIIGLRAG